MTKAGSTSTSEASCTVENNRMGFHALHPALRIATRRIPGNLFFAGLSLAGDVEAVEEFLWPVRVYYEDTDSGGVVYYANYLKFMERARTEWLRSLGFEQDALKERDGVIFAVHSVRLEFFKSARFNDQLHVSVIITRLRKASMAFRQDVIRRGGGMQVLCRGQIEIACVSAVSLKPTAIPERILAEIPR